MQVPQRPDFANDVLEFDSPSVQFCGPVWRHPTTAKLLIAARGAIPLVGSIFCRVIQQSYGPCKPEERGAAPRLGSTLPSGHPSPDGP